MRIRSLAAAVCLVLAGIVSGAEDGGAKQLSDAIDKGDVGEVNRLLASGISANVPMITKGTEFGDLSYWPINQAAASGRLEVVRALLDHGAKVNAADPEGMQPIHHAAEKNHFEIIKFLLDRGADPNARWPEEDRRIARKK